MKLSPVRPATFRRLLQHDNPSFATSRHADGTLSAICTQYRTYSRSIYTRQYGGAEFASLKSSYGPVKIRRTIALPAVFVAGQRRSLATVQNCTRLSVELVQKLTLPTVNRDNFGPIQEYDARVKSGRLRDDEHQRGGNRPSASNISC
jgi:hypothetical protein